MAALSLNRGLVLVYDVLRGEVAYYYQGQFEKAVIEARSGAFTDALLSRLERDGEDMESMELFVYALKPGGNTGFVAGVWPDGLWELSSRLSSFSA